MATGTPIRLTGILNEEKFTGKGVHYCVECDGPFFQKKKVVIIGHGNHATEDALDMTVYTRNVTIISNAPEFDFSCQMQVALKQNKIKLINQKIKSFTGTKFADTVTFENNKSMKVDGIFMACGTASTLDFSSKLGLSIEKNILTVDQDNKTSIEGIFSAGNCCARCRQVVKNIGDGCNVALSAIKYLKRKDLYFDYSTPK